MEMKILAVGDVVGTSGLRFLEKKLRTVKKEHSVDFCIVNGENASMNGITPDQAESIFRSGADVITLGNHVWGKREIVSYLEDNAFVLRPANLSPQLPGSGMKTYESSKGPVTVINLVGRCFMDYTPQNPFLLAEKLLKDASPVALVEIHAQVSSEKLAMAYMLDGKVSAVYGTHTHVPAADLQILPGGTASITDLGMTGPAQSVIGIRPEQSIAMFRGDLTSRFEQAPGPCCLQAALFTVDCSTGRCLAAEQILLRE